MEIKNNNWNKLSYSAQEKLRFLNLSENSLERRAIVQSAGSTINVYASIERLYLLYCLCHDNLAKQYVPYKMDVALKSIFRKMNDCWKKFHFYGQYYNFVTVNHFFDLLRAVLNRLVTSITRAVKLLNVGEYILEDLIKKFDHFCDFWKIYLEQNQCPPDFEIDDINMICQFIDAHHDFWLQCDLKGLILPQYC